MKYNVEITETLQKTVEVEAEDESEAIEKVKQLYYDEKIILMDNDLVETSLDIIEVNKGVC